MSLSGHGSDINLGEGIGAALGTCNTVSEGNYSYIVSYMRKIVYF